MERKWSNQARILVADWQAAEYKRLKRSRATEDQIREAMNRTAALFGAAPGTPAHSAIVSAMLGNYREQQSRVPTSFESPHWYAMASILVEEVEQAAKARLQESGIAPLYGSVPSGALNAVTVYVPKTKEYLIVFSEGLFLFLNLMSKLAADAAITAINATPPGTPLDRTKLAPILAHPRFHERFFDALYSYVVLGDAGLAEQYVLAGSAMNLADNLRHTSELFIVAHEYGHILAGHLTSLSQQMSPEKTRSGEFVYRPEWLDELAADDIGTELVLAIARPKVGAHTSVASIHLALYCLEIADSIVNVLTAPYNKIAAVMDALGSISPAFHEGERPADTHPSPFARRAKQRSRIAEFLGQDLAGEANEMGEDIIQLLHHLWVASRPRWLKLRDAETKPCPWWNPRAQLSASGTEGPP